MLPSDVFGIKTNFNANALVVTRNQSVNFTEDSGTIKTEYIINRDNDWTLYIVVPLALSIFLSIVLFFWWAVTDTALNPPSFPGEVDYERLNEETMENDSSEQQGTSSSSNHQRILISNISVP